MGRNRGCLRGNIFSFLKVYFRKSPLAVLVAFLLINVPTTLFIAFPLNVALLNLMINSSLVFVRILGELCTHDNRSSDTTSRANSYDLNLSDGPRNNSIFGKLCQRIFLRMNKTDPTLAKSF